MISKSAREFLENAKKTSENFYDNKINELNINLNDQILVKDFTRSKMDPMFLGPFRIIEINKPNVKYLDHKNKMKEIHFNNIVKFRQ